MLIAPRAVGAIPETALETSYSVQSPNVGSNRRADGWIAVACLGLALAIGWSLLGVSEATEGVSPPYVPSTTPSAELAGQSGLAPGARLVITKLPGNGGNRASLPESFSLSQHDFFDFIVIDWVAMGVGAPLSTPGQ